MSGTSELTQRLADRIMQRCDELARCSEQPGMITRTFGSPAMHDAYARIRRWMEESGMTCRIDAAGNLRGRFNPAVSDRTLLIGWQ